MKIPDYSGAGIYKIKIGSALYVGSSKNIKKRIRSHLSNIANGTEMKKIQAAAESGEEIHVDILEKISDNETVWHMLLRERYWIEQLRPELNSAPPGGYDDVFDRIRAAEENAKRYDRMAASNRAYAKDMKRKYLRKIGGGIDNKQEETGNK